jgi:hypothetical protein
MIRTAHRCGAVNYRGTARQATVVPSRLAPE